MVSTTHTHTLCHFFFLLLYIYIYIYIKHFSSLLTHIHTHTSLIVKHISITHLYKLISFFVSTHIPLYFYKHMHTLLFQIQTHFSLLLHGMHSQTFTFLSHLHSSLEHIYIEKFSTQTHL
jgi:hypothetical protein